ncbi:response regulator [Patescibacteria group bacterium]|nr:response regulator [Patescibacteria group bacterium]
MIARNKKKIFIVDDDEFLLDMYSVKFRENDFEVETASNSSEALDKINAGLTPDVILLDLVMPGLDGFEFMKKIKEKKLIPRSLIIILTNLGEKEDVDKGMKMGANDYIIKAHYTPSEVVKKVKELLQ